MATIFDLHEAYVRGTPRRAVVRLAECCFAYLPQGTVFLNTRVLKHTYDKRTAQRFDLLLEYLPEILQNPDQIYANKLGQRGTYCFVKECQAELCLSSIEYKEVSGTYRFEVVTFYVVDNEYLRNYELIWERKGDESSS